MIINILECIVTAVGFFVSGVILGSHLDGTGSFDTPARVSLAIMLAVGVSGLCLLVMP